MSDFFKSEIVIDELKEINELQEELYVNIMRFGQMNKEDQLKHIDKLSALLEKQKLCMPVCHYQTILMLTGNERKSS